MLPDFDATGNLVPGIHVATLDEVGAIFAGNPHRRWLFEGVRMAVDPLSRAHCSRIYLDGSFVSTKPFPSDYDACYELSGMNLQELRKIEPVFFEFSSKRAAQKAKFRGEWFPAEMQETKSGITFLDFFRIDRNTGGAKGIVALEI